MSALVVVADDDPFNLRLLQELCEAAGYRVATSSNGRELLEVVARERPDLIMVDVDMPELNGFEVMRILKDDPTLATIPVIMVTASDDVESRSQSIALGAEDYVTKPYRVFEIQQRIRNALRIGTAEMQAASASERVREAELVDELTHAGTSQQLVISLDYEYTRAERYHHQLTCIVVALTNYSQIVATCGEPSGEGVLVQLAGGLRSCVRGIDHLFRSDLSEFVLLLPETGEAGSKVVTDRLLARSDDESLWTVAIAPAPELRVGIATYPDAEVTDGNGLLRKALDKLREA